MAILLTKEYKQISTISLNYGEIRTYAKYNSQDNINAYTTYDIKTTYYVPTQNYVSFASGNLTVDGNRIDYGYTTIYKGETTLMEFQRTLQHENDGTSPIKNIETTFNASFGGSGSTNVDIQMPKIARLPVITGLENINDEQNPKIVFTNPAGFYLKAYFYRLSGYEFIRENIKSPYTFELTTDERNEIREFMKNMQSDSTPAITIEAYSSKDFSESSYIGEATKSIKVSITNATPTVSLNVVETNQKVIDVYGGNTATTVVKNVSKLKLTSTIGLKKYATLKSRTYTYNSNQTSNAESITIVPTVNKVSIKAVDSRNLSKTADKTLNMVDYTPIIINSFRFYRTSATSNEIRLSADITYFQGTYNKVVNTPIIKYKKGANGTLRTLSANDYTLNTTNKKITINNLVLEDTLAYTEQETFYLYVDDIFSSDSENNPVIKGIPTTERGEFDFQVNGTLNLADTSRNKYGTINKSAFTYSGNTYANNKRNDILLQNKFTTRPTNANVATDGSGGLSKFLSTGSMTSNKPTDDGHILQMHWDTTAGWDSQLFVGNGIIPKMRIRGQNAGTWGSWLNVAMCPTVLYNNTTGTTGTVTLSSSSANFTCIEIFYNKEGLCGSVKIYNPNGKTALLSLSCFVGTVFQIVSKRMKINGTSMTVIDGTVGYLNAYSTDRVEVLEENEMYITTVLGYNY